MTNQLEFDWLVATYRPLLTVSETQIILHDCSAQHVLNLLDEGRLAGVDIGNGSVERCVRVWRHAALHAALKPELPLPVIATGEILPHHRPTIFQHELARWCGCAANTVAGWGLAGPRTDRRNVFFREAVIEFLERQKI
ncbi:MAG: hypothetical protein LBK76_04610 [Verrucomicrobiales bacterium]|jgi:hypothetical protein|nr:hypothetical protein [Verrucomicrobiales bacterium]